MPRLTLLEQTWVEKLLVSVHANRLTASNIVAKPIAGIITTKTLQKKFSC